MDLGFHLAAMNCSYRFLSLESFFLSAAETGYRAVELWTGPMHFYVDHIGHDPIEPLKQLSVRYGVAIIGICPEQTNPKPWNIAARGRTSRDRTFRYFTQQLELASALGADHVVVTSGWGFLDEPRSDAWRRSVEMLRAIGCLALEADEKLVIEALQPEETNLARTAPELHALIDAVGCPALSVCLDTGAMWRAGETPQDYFDLFGSRVTHCHFVDAAGSSHIPWGTGTRDMTKDLRSFIANGYHGFLGVETDDEISYQDPVACDRETMRRYRAALREVEHMS